MQHIGDDICVQVCFSQFHSPVRATGIHDFITFALELSKTLDITYNSIGYTCVRSGASENVVRTPRFTVKNLALLREIIEDHLVLKVSFFSTTKSGMDDPIAYVNLNLKTEGLSVRNVFVQVDGQRFSEHVVSRNVWAMSLLRNMETFADIQYALMTTMSNSKMPGFYFAGISTNGLDYDERLDLATWNENAVDCAEKLRGLYDGNLLGPGHLKRIPQRKSFESRLRGIIGDEQITEIVTDKLYVSLLPSRHIRQEVGQLFDEYHLLMKPSAVAINLAQHG